MVLRVEEGLFLFAIYDACFWKNNTKKKQAQLKQFRQTQWWNKRKSALVIIDPNLFIVMAQLLEDKFFT